jgi:hypothetical protein
VPSYCYMLYICSCWVPSLNPPDSMYVSSCCYMCPHTAIYVSSYCCMCPHTAVCVSSNCCICVLILLYACPHTATCLSSYCYMCVLIQLYMCRHTAICVSSCCCTCVRILLYMYPHACQSRTRIPSILFMYSSLNSNQAKRQDKVFLQKQRIDNNDKYDRFEDFLKLALNRLGWPVQSTRLCCQTV